ncbi:conserved repeat domain-containing protein [Thalassococcus halodurans]|uniref:Conserved repeat domain-containing protein n=1 Tax=Thalassococcus halodurans TaxID=373675 RepID=A0A1H5S0A5_9RHOB|nr:DUF11 domain-containing protein [Thalassococcus halodurans]SEF43338.1 conserved repeat domain-containing protein [Thalassococcus halodurans]
MADYDITDPGDSTTVDGVIFEDAANIGSGTGNYDTFLALNDNDGTIAGFNSDDSGSIDPSNSNMDASKSEAILLGSLTTVWIDGVEYYEIRLDLNENNKEGEAAKSQISMEAFKIYTSTDGTIEDLATLETQNLIYDLDGTEDNTLFLSEESTGSGTDDYAIYIPVSQFEGLDPATTYFYLYTEMGREEPWEENAGFEEFNQQEAGLIAGTKFEDENSNGIQDAGEEGLEGIVIYHDADNDGQLDTWDTNLNGIVDDGEVFDEFNNEQFDVTDENGYYTLTGIATSSEPIIIREELTGENADYIATNYDGVDEFGPYWEASITDGGQLVTKDIGNFIPNPSIVIDKVVMDVGGDGAAAVVDEADDQITYHLVVTNDGNVALSNVTVTDPLTGTNYLIGALGVGETVTIGDGDDVDVVYTATQDDLDGNGGGDGDIDNTATATGEYGDDTVSDSDDEAVLIELEEGINLIKTSDTVTINGATTVTYDFTLTNTGNYAQEITSVVDQGFIIGDTSDDFTLYDGSAGIVAEGDTDGDGLLDVGETWTFSRDVDITQEMFDDNLGGLTNIACAYTPDTFHCDGHDIDRYNLSIDKVVYSVDGSTSHLVVDAADEEVIYHIDVTNTGDLDLTGLQVIDTIADTVAYLEEVSGDGDDVFEAGETWRFEASYTATQGDLDTNGDGDGTIENIATADTNETGEVSDDADVPIEQIGGIALDKTSDTTYVAGAADVTYTYTLTNTGNYAQAITSAIDDNFTPADASDDITLYDGTGAVTGDKDGDGLLDVGEEWSFSTTVSITQEDFDANIGGLTNVACAVTADGIKACDEHDLNRAIIAIDKVVKDINGDAANTTVLNAGDVINYQITVTNTGEETLTNVIVTDPLTGLNENIGSIEAGASATLDVSYTVQQADIDGNGIDYLGVVDGDGDVDNTATADSDQTDKVSDSEEVDITLIGGIDIEKTSTTTYVSRPDDGGTEVTYTITISADEDANHAQAIASVVDEGFDGEGGFAATLYTNGDATSAAMGDIDEDGLLDIGEEWTFSYTATITQEMFDDGLNDLTNVACATPVEGEKVCDDHDIDRAILAIDKQVTSINNSATQTTVLAAGDVIYYDIIVTNTGEVALTGVTVVDPLTKTDVLVGDLAVGASSTVQASYIVQQADIDGYGVDYLGLIDGDGDVDNTATADSDQTDEVSDSEEVDIQELPDIKIDKLVVDVGGDGTGLTAADAEGDVITYGIIVTNTGNQTLTDIVVTDPLTGLSYAYDGSLAPDASFTIANGQLDKNGVAADLQYSVTQADLDSYGGGDGDIDNTATAVGQARAVEVSDDDSEEVDVVYAPDMGITKVATIYNEDGSLDEDQRAETAGDYISYSFEVSNLGNITLTEVLVEDATIGYSTTIDAIEVGGSVTLEPIETVIVTQAMLDAQDPTKDGQDDECDFENTVTATAVELDGSVSDTECSNFDYDPNVDIEKLISVNGGAFVDADSPTGPEVDIVGETVTFRIEVTNTGNISLTDVTIEDLKYVEGVFHSEVTVPTLIGLTDEDGDGEFDDLAVGAVAYVEYTDVLTADQHRNDATVTTAEGVTDTDSAHYFGLISDGPGVRTPGGWGNSPKLQLYWDGIEGNEPHVSDTDNFPDQELLSATEVDEGIFIIGDHMNGGDGVLGEGEYAITLKDAWAILEQSGGRYGSKDADLLRHAIATELNMRAGNGYQDTTPDIALDSPEEWLAEAIEWYDVNSNGPMKGKNSVWNHEQNGISAGSDIMSALDEYNNFGTIDEVRFAHDADSAEFQAAMLNVDAFLFA